jgi:hypothetical protein
MIGPERNRASSHYRELSLHLFPFAQTGIPGPAIAKYLPRRVALIVPATKEIETIVEAVTLDNSHGKSPWRSVRPWKSLTGTGPQIQGQEHIQGLLAGVHGGYSSGKIDFGTDKSAGHVR